MTMGGETPRTLTSIGRLGPMKPASEPQLWLPIASMCTAFSNFGDAGPEGQKTHAILASCAAVAQLDRVLGYEPRGRGFNSCQPHHSLNGLEGLPSRPFSFAAPRA